MTEDVPYLVDSAGQRFPLSQPVIRLGRAPECEVFVADRRASRRHAEVRREAEGYTLHDQASANGTFLNGRRLTAPAALCDSDQIAVAGALFTFRDPEATLRTAGIPALVADLSSGEVWVDREPVHLSPREQALFRLLYQAPGRVHSKAEISRAVWPEYRSAVLDYQIESLVKRLREKLEPNPHYPVLILTVPGYGYRLATG
ncbi:MAG: winged helix-turn-helix domain-containing protein [Chloroflexi bacterium]|nr:winged helix-turn-helix domain-containing protein [Chloroflexota bacterium]